jgi:spoIIIJ-associated protein
MGTSKQQALLDRAQTWVETLLNLCDLSAPVTAAFIAPPEHLDGADEHDEVIWLDIQTDALTPEQTQLILGDSGATLDAMQYLASLQLNLDQDKECQFPYTLDLQGYRNRRYSELAEMVKVAIAQVHTTGEEYELCGLSSAERRQVHGLLKHESELENFSRGREPDRRLVVRRLVVQPEGAPLS